MGTKESGKIRIVRLDDADRKMKVRYHTAETTSPSIFSNILPLQLACPPDDKARGGGLETCWPLEKPTVEDRNSNMSTTAVAGGVVNDGG